MKSLKPLIFVLCFSLSLCMGKAFADTCYSPGYGNYECNPSYEYSPEATYGGDYFGVVVGGGGYYGGGYNDNNWHGNGNNWHGGEHGGYHGGYHGAHAGGHGGGHGGGHHR